MAATPKPSSSTKRKRKTLSPTTTHHHHHQNHHHNHRSSTLSPLIPAVTSAISAAHSFILTHDLHLLPSHSLSLESHLSSAFHYLSKLQSFLQIKPQICNSLSLHSGCWFERFLLSASADEDPRWVQIFRMSKPTFYLLNSIISHSLSSCFPSIQSDFALGAALYRLAHNGSFSLVGRRFGLSSKDACRAFYVVCKVICDQLDGYLGDFGSEMERILAGFERISLPSCCGVLGLEKFLVEGELLGKDGFLMVQALVDSDGRFLDVSAGWPSTFKPELILRQTRLFLGVEESKELLNGLPFELKNGNLLPQYVLGDSCYPLMPWLLTPFVKSSNGEELSSKEMEFNEVHNRAMGVVGLAFGRVRANWQLLNRKRWKEECVEFLPFIIMMACLLNNFLMKHGETLLDREPGCLEEQDMPVYDGEANEGRGSTRELLALHLSQSCPFLEPCRDLTGELVIREVRENTTPEAILSCRNVKENSQFIRNLCLCI